MVVVVLSLACVLDFVGGAGGGADACRMSPVHFRITTFTAFYMYLAEVSCPDIINKRKQFFNFSDQKKNR